ncbi:iron(II)-dependent oxidoreductase EgtB [mine drainage metagenome]|uniref:Iron(II)-dependent oxidoreductase EgtB n=1 Tax=mine drainage metagenome TaxID=410659 RepID=A0A1J5PKG0_9ZZZZ
MNPALLAQAYRTVRQHTVALAAPLTAEDCCVQSMPDASPTKWHLGHTSWFFETFVLERWEVGFEPFDAAFRVLFNSYYNTVGDKHPRPQRGLLTRPGLAVVLAYRANVDQRMLALLATQPVDTELLTLVELGIQHEQQHQELLLTDIKHLFSRSPLLPRYSEQPQSESRIQALSWKHYAGGVVDIGDKGEGFCFDNETPSHQVFLQAYRLASRLVTNGEYADFIAAGGYVDPAFWLSEGWDWRVGQQREHPLYWHFEGAQWHEFTLGGLLALDAHRPVVHLSYYEADAYARWIKARLPTEFEWERAAVSDAGLPEGLIQLFDSAWQWTSSSYAAYPGFRVSPGAVGEYNGKFMVNQYVLRGSSVATPPGHSRATYRNFFQAAACWQFTGIRLAMDV